MASFVEQATLVVNDKSSANLNKINRALKTLFSTAKSLKGVNVKLQVDDSQVKKAAQSVRLLRVELRQLGNVAKNIKVNAAVAGFGKAAAAVKGMTRNVQALNAVTRQARPLTVNTHGITQAQARVNALRASARAPITITTRGAGGVGGAGVGGRGGGFRRRHSPTAAVVAGAAAGGGIPAFSRLNSQFGVLAISAYGAAAALKKIGDAGYERSRTEAQTKAMSSARQQAVQQTFPPGHKGAPIPFRANVYERLRNEIRGDVAADTEEQTERNAEAMVRYLQNELYPGLVLRNPSLTPEAAGEGMKKVIRAGGLATTAMIDDKGNITEDWKRFAAGIQEALRVNPDIPFTKINTTIAGLRTAGYQFDPDMIARTIVMAGDKGARVGNEWFQFQQSMRGVFKNKALNAALAKRGVQLPGGGLKKEDMLGANPAQWIFEEFSQDVDKHLAKKDTQARIAKAVAGGKSQEMAEQNERVNILGRLLPGLKQTTLSALAAGILDQQQWLRQRGQSGIAANPEEAKRIAAANPAIQWENLKTAIDAASGSLGKLALDATAASGFFTGLTKLIRGEPMTDKEIGAVGVGGTVAAAGGLGLIKLLSSPLTALNTAGTNLNSAGLQLQAAARALGASGGVPGAPGGNAPGGKGSKMPPQPKGGRGGNVGRLGPLALIAGLIYYDYYSDVAKEAAKAEDATRKLAYAHLELYAAQKRLEELESGKANPPKTSPFSHMEPGFLEARNAEIAALRAQIEALKTKINQILPGTLPPDAKKPPNKAMAKILADQEKQDAAKRPPSAAGQPDALNSITLAKDAMDNSSKKMADSVLALAAIPGSFVEVFGQAKTTLGGAGDEINRKMRAEASSIGGLIGAAFVAKANTASVAFKMPGTGLDTGGLRVPARP